MLLDGVKYSFQLLGDFSVSTENTTIHLRGLLGNQLSSLFAYFYIIIHNLFLKKK